MRYGFAYAKMRKEQGKEKNSMSKDWTHTQQHEADSWLSPDPKVRRDKEIRERIRYPLIKKQMGLANLDTSQMLVYDIGPGPFGGVSSVINYGSVIRFEPLMREYAKFYPLQDYNDAKAEDIGKRLEEPDLVIVTNALDHFQDPNKFMYDLRAFMKPGAFFAHIHAINNAYSHPHEAHAHNVNEEFFKKHLGEDFELCWQMSFQHDGLTYGWRKQPALSQLWRKVAGYGGEKHE